VQRASGQHFVVSHYVDNPLLVNGYKFDLRIYVAITCINPLRIYIYEEGLARFATEKYNTQNDGKGNRYIHLTNYSVNKNNENFVQNQDRLMDNVGSKWSLTALKEYLRKQHYDLDYLFEKIEDLIIKSIIAVEDIVFTAHHQQVSYRHGCFELLGYDILIDANLQPWLLEVNLSPSLACDSPLDVKIKGELLSDLFTLVGVVPVDQRAYYDTINQKNYIANMNRQGFEAPAFKEKGGMSAAAGHGPELTREARMIIKETEEEMQR
jgi:tubulin polyglutamylase TTLL5